jgi:hypothetical protein
MLRTAVRPGADPPIGGLPVRSRPSRLTLRLAGADHSYIGLLLGQTRLRLPIRPCTWELFGGIHASFPPDRLGRTEPAALLALAAASVTLFTMRRPLGRRR